MDREKGKVGKFGRGEVSLKPPGPPMERSALERQCPSRAVTVSQPPACLSSR